MNSRYMIKKIEEANVRESGAMELVWRVFLEFEAPEYSEEGIAEFQKFITLEAVEQRMAENGLLLWGCYDADDVVGIIATRPPCHIALLFVDKAYHRQGIARRLYNTVENFYKINGTCAEITVNSSPYAVGAYRRMGFIDTARSRL